MNLVGKLIDNRYEILEKVGNGGMATVYKAKDNVLNRFVAVKILRDEFTTDSDFIKRFNSEAQSAASLTHPNIVGIYDVGNEDNLYYIVMELIQGKTLKEIINEDGKLPWKWSVNIAIQIASALEVAHKNNIIHRDIKPHNIIITEDGLSKVTDFGIAKAVSNSTITAFGTTIGSVHYFSPEHARGGYTDAKSDLYSLGVVMYEMLTGKVPFDADTPVSVALKQVQEEPIDPIEYNKNIPISVNRIILKAMQKDPSLRYQNATEMIEDLKMALKRPDEDFVVLAYRDEDSPTQKVPTIYEINMEKNNEKNAPKLSDKKDDKKEKGKILKFIEEHPFVRFLIIVAIFAMIFIGVALAVMIGIKRSVPKDAHIPVLVFTEEDKMLTEKEAIKKLKDAGFENYKIERKSSETVPAGYVIGQDPDDTISHKVTEEIKIIVSSGPEIVKLPEKMVGANINDIKTQLEKLGMADPVINYETSEEIEKDIIMSVEPADIEGDETTKATVITFKVSSGSKFQDVEMPSVIGDTESDALNKLENGLNLVVKVEYEEDGSKVNGIVLRQSIERGTIIKEQSDVTIVVNKLPEDHTVVFKVNVAAYYPSSSTPTNSVDNTTNTTSNTTNTNTNVPVQLIVGGVPVKNVSTSKNSTVELEYTTSGRKEVQITVDNNEKYRQYIDFDSDKTIEIN